MKQFSLEEYLKNPSLKVITRDGRNARIICTDMRSEFPIVAIIGKEDRDERVDIFTKDGRYCQSNKNSDSFLDLLENTIKRTLNLEEVEYDGLMKTKISFTKI